MRHTPHPVLADLGNVRRLTGGEPVRPRPVDRRQWLRWSPDGVWKPSGEARS